MWWVGHKSDVLTKSFKKEQEFSLIRIITGLACFNSGTDGATIYNLWLKEVPSIRLTHLGNSNT